MSLNKSYEQNMVDTDIELNITGEISSDKYKDITIQRAIQALSRTEDNSFIKFIILINTLESLCRADNTIDKDDFKTKLDIFISGIDKTIKEEIKQVKIATYKFELIMENINKRKYDTSPLIIRSKTNNSTQVFEDDDEAVEIEN